jgi:hypothetical protein
MDGAIQYCNAVDRIDVSELLPPTLCSWHGWIVAHGGW